jgi:3-hydroxybutyryl-CoA dehydratase
MSTDAEKTVDKAMPLEVGDSVTFSKTVGESDVYLFAGITGDFSPNHVNKEIM